MMLNGVRDMNDDYERQDRPLTGREDVSSWRTGGHKTLGTRERQERDRQALRQAILDAARELFVADGFERVSMRRIAERIEYSPAAIYSYFPSKDDIYFALAEEGFRLLCDGIAIDPAASADDPDPLNTLRRHLQSFYRFNERYPEHFALMFLDRSVPKIRDSYQRIPFIISIKNMLARTVDRCIELGIFPPSTDALTACRMFTTATLGAASVRVCNRLAPEEDGGALAHDLVELIIAGLRAGTPLTFRPSPFARPDAAPPPPAPSRTTGEDS